MSMFMLLLDVVKVTISTKYIFFFSHKYISVTTDLNLFQLHLDHEKNLSMQIAMQRNK